MRLAASVLAIRSAPTVKGSSTSSFTGSLARASIITGFRPKHISHASASIGVIAGTTEQIADPVIPSEDAIASPVIERIRIASSSAVRGAAVVRRQCDTSSSPLKNSNRDLGVADVEHRDH